MDARLFSLFKFIIGTVGNPSACLFGIVKSYGSYGTGRVAILSSLAARGIGTEQAAGRLFCNMYHLVHGSLFYKLNVAVYDVYSLLQILAILAYASQIIYFRRLAVNILPIHA